MTAAQTPPVAESVEVTQADREAAAALFTIRGHDGDRVREAVGLLLARHRAAAYEAGRAEGVRAAEQLRTALIQARSDFHLISLHGEMRPMWEDAKAGRDRVHDALVSIDAIRALSKEPTK